MLVGVSDVFNMEADVFDAYHSSVAHAVRYLKAVSAFLWKDHVFPEIVAVVNIVSSTFAIPPSINIGQWALKGVVGYASIGEGGVDEEEGVGVGVVGSVADVDDEVIDGSGVVDLNVEVEFIVEVPTVFVHSLVIGIILFAVATGEHQQYDE